MCLSSFLLRVKCFKVFLLSINHSFAQIFMDEPKISEEFAGNFIVKLVRTNFLAH